MKLSVLPTAVTTAVDPQVVSVTALGDTSSGDTAMVPTTLETVTVVEWPLVSRMTMGMLSRQTPVGRTSKLPPLNPTVSRVTTNPELGLVMV